MKLDRLSLTSNFPPGSISDAMAGDDHAEQKPMIMEPIETAIAAKTWTDQINSYTTASNVNSSQDYPSK